MQWCAPISIASAVALPNPRWTRATSYHSNVPHTGQVVNLRPAHPEHLDKGGCQMPIARFPHLKGVGVEKGPADESLQDSAAQPPNLRGSGGATLGRPFPPRAVGALPKQSPDGGDRATQIYLSIATAPKRATALACEKAHRLSIDHPKRQILGSALPAPP